MRLILSVVFLILSFAGQADDPVPSRILTSEKMPFNYVENEQISGLTIDLVTLLFEQQLPKDIELMPWPRAYATALEQKNVLIFTMGRTPEREAAGFRYIGPVSRRFHALYAVRSDLPPIHNFADIRKHRLVVAGLRAGWLSEQFQAAGIKIDAVGNYQQGMDMLLKNRAQLWLSTDLEEQVLQAQHVDAPQLKPVWRIMCSENYLALSPGSDEVLFQHLQTKYRRLMQSTAPQTVAAKWRAKLNLPLIYRPSSGFYMDDPALLKCVPSAQAG